MTYNDITRKLASDNRTLQKLIRNRRYHSKRRRIVDRSILLLFILSFSFLIVIALEHRLISSHLIIKNVLQEGINYDAFREMKLDKKAIEKAENRVSHILKKEPELASLAYLDTMGYITFSMMANNYDLIDNALVSEATFLKGIRSVKENEAFLELYGYYRAVLSGLEYFPVPKVETAEVTYVDSWYQLRTYGGNRRHEGCDLMASNNKRGFFPIVSITEGIVEKMGWLEQGGYRIGVRTQEGGYFYYAHLFSYAPE
ncbi:MAG: M23 family metallopeptidase, partial [Mobilitalea sp.]